MNGETINQALRWRRIMAMLIVLSLSFLSLQSTQLFAANRYTALFPDNTRVSGEEIASWGTPGAIPQLAGRSVGDPKNLPRWILDLSAPVPATPTAYFEFFGGDRLPARMLAARTGLEVAAERVPAHFLVEPLIDLHWREHGNATALRISQRWLKRIVWESTGSDVYRPGQLLLKDGRQIPYRDLRWSDKSLSVLVEEGIETIPLGDLAELHFPVQNEWNCYLDQAAILAPDGTGSLLRIETTNGLIATTSTARFLPATNGGTSADHWFHIVQPAWALEPLSCSFRTIRSWQFHGWHNPPLTRFSPAAVRQKSTFGSGWRWRRGTSVQGERLRSGGLDFGWGFGVHAESELTFDLPPGVRSFRVRAGLDEAVGSGGCVKWSVFRDGERNKPLFASPAVVGSQIVLDSGMLNVAATVLPNRLVLYVDPHHAGRPAGADPYDIRDSLNWLEPELSFDPVEITRELRLRSAAAIDAWDGWEIEPHRSAFKNGTAASPSGGGPASRSASGNVAPSFITGNWLDTSEPKNPRWRLTSAASLPFSGVEKMLAIGPQHRWLALAVSRADPTSGEVELIVRFDGQKAQSFIVPLRQASQEPEPILVSLDGLAGRTVRAEIIVVPTKAETPLDWRSIQLWSRRPGLLPLFEDEAATAAALNEGPGKGELFAANVYSGRQALRVTNGWRGTAQLPNLEAAIRAVPRMGEYRYLRFAWRKQGGKQIGMSFAVDGSLYHRGQRRRIRIQDPASFRDPFEPRHVLENPDGGFLHSYRYAAGPQRLAPGESLVIDGQLPAKWTIVTRDLFAEFGSFTLTGLAFDCPDGDAAEFDHIYLARTAADFNFAPSPVAGAKPVINVPPKKNQVVLATAETSNDRRNLLQLPASQFELDDKAGNVSQWAEYRGRKNVLQLTTQQATPRRLRAAIFPSPGKKPVLKVRVSTAEKSSWQLVIKAGEEVVARIPVVDAKLINGWHEQTFDFAKFSDKKFWLHVIAEPTTAAPVDVFIERIEWQLQ